MNEYARKYKNILIYKVFCVKLLLQCLFVIILNKVLCNTKYQAKTGTRGGSYQIEIGVHIKAKYLQIN